MENFRANWQELKARISEVSIRRERLTKIFYDYYYPKLERKASYLINQHKLPNIEGDKSSLAADTLIEFIKRLSNDPDTIDFPNESKLGSYLTSILYNLINSTYKKRGRDKVTIYDDESKFDEYHSVLNFQLFKTEFDSFESIAAIVKSFKEVFYKKNEFCYKLLNDILIWGYNYKEILELDLYKDYNYSSLRKKKERCQQELFEFLTKNKNHY